MSTPKIIGIAFLYSSILGFLTLLMTAESFMQSGGALGYIIAQPLSYLLGELASSIILGAAYMLWLAWKIATATGINDKSATGQPMTFLEAAAFQWLNPKAWAMALGAATTYTPEGGGRETVLILAGAFMLVGAPCSAAWAGFGQGLRRFLDRPAILRTFNVTMAVLLVASLYPLMTQLKA